MLVGTPVPCEPCPSHSNFEGPLHPPFPLAFSALTLPDCPADPDKHIGISDHVWIWSDTHTKKKKNCLASSSFDLKCAEFNPCRSDVVPRWLLINIMWMFPKKGHPKMDGLQWKTRWFGGTTIFGNIHVLHPSYFSHRRRKGCRVHGRLRCRGRRDVTLKLSKLLDHGIRKEEPRSWENFFSEKTPYQKWQISKGRNSWKSPTKYEKEILKKFPKASWLLGSRCWFAGVYLHMTSHDPGSSLKCGILKRWGLPKHGKYYMIRCDNMIHSVQR